MNRSADGFYKAYAVRRLGGPDIPFPRMAQVGLPPFPTCSAGTAPPGKWMSAA